MYAIVETGGKQYRVQPGDRIDVERLPGAVGDTIDLDRVLFVGDGPEGAKQDSVRVIGKIVEQARGPKILVFKMKRRKMYRRKRGHRQHFTRLQIEDIEMGGVSTKSAAQAKQKKPLKAEGKPKAKVAEKAAKPEAEKAPAKKTAPEKAAPKKTAEEKAPPSKAAPKKAAPKKATPKKAASAEVKKDAPKKAAPQKPAPKKEASAETKKAASAKKAAPKKAKEGDEKTPKKAAKKKPAEDKE